MNKEKEVYELEGELHRMHSIRTPLRPDAFEKSDTSKIEAIEGHFKAIMEELGLDLTDDSLKGTPYRVAKMYVKELFYGLNPTCKPSVSIFHNSYGYEKMLIERDITFHSACEHHFMPIIGKAHVGYIAGPHVIGLSKINRLVDYYARRPQVQERLCLQIFTELKDILQTENVIVVVEAEHLCVSTRGVKDATSRTITLEFGGQFKQQAIRKEFFQLIDSV
ncbi:GTP cyclohydrolase I FolE [Siphonobacter sp. SORGH_AS_1065]|uniref:GTP cyclohydrolase I FolE n=1 Tax=Siphonobacter sp. SORGH_AS_1065 TaxID=3041795 RepID=UPI0027803957|nr:GTP cyclohydrolase I FolE [Siphonobacter sp. SORGH_AS_1065]MDQ1090296.1 GTP cyclohydrolase I [Siphonobacter sp. SORGH_AS_1065]